VHWSVVGRLLDSFDKEIARSVLFLSPVLAARQSPADDSDMRLECPDAGHLTLDVDLSSPLPAGFSPRVVHNHLGDIR
jgi:hypothetical protein